MKYIPRNAMILVRRVQLGQTPKGIGVPDTSIEGVEHVVVAVGKKVEDLKEGDKVLINGTIGQDYAFLPNSKDLIITHDNNIVLKYEETEL